MFRPSSYLTGPIPEVKIPERRRVILVVTPFAARASSAVEHVARELVGEITANHNFDLHRMTPDFGEGQEDLPHLWLTFRRTLHARKNLRAQIWNSDLVWLHEANSLASLWAFRTARELRKPVFITQHRGPGDRTGILGRIFGKIADIYFAEDMFREARQTSFTSDAAADYYYRRVAFTAPVKIIPNGADLSIFRPASPTRRGTLRARFALRDDQPVLLFAGSFDRGDEMAAVRFLAKQMPEWRFWIAGEGKENPAEWFLPNVQTFPKRSGAAMAELYQAADLMILPHNGSAFPPAAQEAMACGLPVMCSPSLATGCDSAKPYLWAVDVFDGDPRATAALWATRLKAGRPLLPLNESKTELSDLAQSSWEWPQIACHYAEILRGLCRNKNV